MAYIIKDDHGTMISSEQTRQQVVNVLIQLGVVTRSADLSPLPRFGMQIMIVRPYGLPTIIIEHA